MRAYAYRPSFIADEEFIVCVEPNKTFCLSLYRQGPLENLSPIGGLEWVGDDRISVVGHSKVGGPMYLSGDGLGPERYDADWDWPLVALHVTGPSSPLHSGIYMAVVWEVDSRGHAVDPVGHKIEDHEHLYPQPPDSDAMALLVGRPSGPTASPLACIIPTATYQAYNFLGGGSFYPICQNGAPAQDVVSLKRPGGGLGGEIYDPPDAYDPGSPRQQFGHWDAKFARWLLEWGIDCDFFTDVDMHAGPPAFDPFWYRLVISVGHHEYWSQAMRDRLRAYVGAGGNYASFSGNTCYRPVSFEQAARGEFVRIRKGEPNWPGYNESDLIGLSYAYGGGHWGDCVQGAWTDTTRNAYGYEVLDPTHWVFDSTKLAKGDTFGQDQFLVGYEADGVPDRPNRFTVLAQSPELADFVSDGVPSGTGRASLGLLEPPSGQIGGTVFNAGTTDWARVLVAEDGSSLAVQQITKNVIYALSVVPP